MQQSPVVFIAGPTAAGKTGLALELCRRFPCEVVCVDSATVYRGLDIGTAKPDMQARKVAPHHLVDICDPIECYSAGRFSKDAVAAVASIQEAGRIPLLVGGTGLYFRALEQGLSPLPEGDIATRQYIAAEAAKHGWPSLHCRLAAADPETAAGINQNDTQRISRALEVFLKSGRGQSDWWRKNPPRTILKPTLRIVVAPTDRAALHRRIEARFDAMLQLGIVDELSILRGKWSLGKDLPAMRLVGYRQVWCHLDGELDYSAMRQNAVAATRQLARRQLTWFRSWQEALWLDPGVGGSNLSKVYAILASELS